MMSAADPSLQPTPIVDSDHPAVIAFAQDAVAGLTDEREKAVRLYYAVRDGFRYDPYQVELSVEGLRASGVIEAGYGWCVSKAVLLAAVCRASGIAARIGLADVRNHLSTQRMREIMKTDIFYRHGYTAIRLDGAWLKATPAFNVELCEKMAIGTLEFDGTEDSIYHPYDLGGRRHMEYLAMHGEHDELPLGDLLATFAKHYPSMPGLDRHSWEGDVAREMGKA